MGGRMDLRAKSIYALIIFCSAFLLFQVEPILGKIIMPDFGGSAGVWIVCLVFFQIVLLLGYGYAHWLTRKFSPRAQVRIHTALLAASLLTLPILPKHGWEPSGPFHPALHILLLLAATVGLPFFVLSSTNPLFQAWYVRNRGAASPYRFYALSNAGSMLALLTYPTLLEPWISTSHQARGWSWAYAVIAVVCGTVAMSSASPDPQSNGLTQAPPPGRMVQALWISLPACASALLLAITHHITQNIASVPLLWIIPLALYLLTFILCFEGRSWYRRDVFLRMLGVALGSLAYALAPGFAGLPITLLIPLFCGCLFVFCMFCHGELARLKPPAGHLTSFYLMSSLGGALGALFVALVAPAAFRGDYELPVAAASCALLAVLVLHRDPASPFYKARWQPAWLLIVTLAAAIVYSLGMTAHEQSKGARIMVRNFYGVLRVVEGVAPNPLRVKRAALPGTDEDARFQKLMNGTIDHGLQFLSPVRRRQPTSYYGPESGIGIILKSAPATTPLKVGIIGLGVGTLATYGRRGDRYEFYEINPLVIRLAQREFTYLHDSEAQLNIVLGDARESLEQEPPQGFDVLVVDAFSGDAVPIHLLTREAFVLYFHHLKPDGVLAMHISNQYLNLAPVVGSAATWLDKKAVLVTSPADSARGIYRATWVLVGSRQGFRGESAVEKAGTVLPPTSQFQWTDDYSSVLKVLIYAPRY